MELNWKAGLLIVTLGAIIGFLLRPVLFPSVEFKTIISEEKVDSTTIIQDARLGWVAQGEMDTRLQDAFEKLEREKKLRPSKVKWETRYNIKDSLRIRDSVAVRYVPFFYADSVYHFAKKTDKWEFATNIGVHTEFYPGVNMFRGKAVMNDLNIVVNYEKPWAFDTGSGLIGFGIGTVVVAGTAYLVK
jgi:hypothetical protein